MYTYMFDIYHVQQLPLKLLSEISKAYPMLTCWNGVETTEIRKVDEVNEPPSPSWMAVRDSKRRRPGKKPAVFLEGKTFGATKMPQGLVDLGQKSITLNNTVSCAITVWYINIFIYIYTYVSSDAISAYLGAWFTIACNLGGGRISATFELESENLSACFATFH